MASDDENRQLLVNHDDNNIQDENQPQEQQKSSFGFKDIPLSTWLIILVEIFERFSYYSLRSLLVLYFTEILHFDESTSKALYSYFSSFAYFTPLLGGTIIADALIGRFKTILYCTMVYTLGGYVLMYAAYDASKLLTYLGLILIAFGTGSIKPNVNVFGAQSLRTDNPQALSTYFSIFYASINIGSVAATLFIPIVKEHFGFAVAFMFPAIGLTLALLIFASGYSKYVHTPPGSSLYTRIFQTIVGASRGKKYIREHNLSETTVQTILSSRRSRAQIIDPIDTTTTTLSSQQQQQQQSNDDDSTTTDSSDDFKPINKIGYLDYAKLYYRAEHVEQLYAVLNVLPIFPFLIFFFLCFGQTSSTFLLQATKMNRKVLGFTIYPPQVTALNAVTILIIVPLFDRIIYPFLRRRGLLLKHLNRVLFGLVLTCLSFCCSAFLEYQIQHQPEESISILYQIPQYVLISLAELFISVCAIEFVYSQSPKAFKSTLNALYNLCSAFGDLIAGLLFTFVHLKHLWQFSLLCAGLVALDFLLFIPVALSFNKKTEKFYQLAHQEFLHPGSTPPTKPEPEYPFQQISENDRQELISCSNQISTVT